MRADDYMLTEDEDYIEQKRSKEEQHRKYLEILRKNDLKRMTTTQENVDIHSVTDGNSSGSDKEGSDQDNLRHLHAKKTSSSLGAKQRAQIGNARDFYPSNYQPQHAPAFSINGHPGPQFFNLPPPIMMNKPSGFQINNQYQSGSGQKASRDMSFDSHSSHDSDKEFISAKNFDPFHRGGYANRENTNDGNVMNDYYGKSISHGYYNKDIPPRFQRKRGHLERN